MTKFAEKTMIYVLNVYSFLHISAYQQVCKMLKHWHADVKSTSRILVIIWDMDTKVLNLKIVGGTPNFGKLLKLTRKKVRKLWIGSQNKHIWIYAKLILSSKALKKHMMDWLQKGGSNDRRVHGAKWYNFCNMDY
jgi:hypothetical protein